MVCIGCGSAAVSERSGCTAQDYYRAIDRTGALVGVMFSEHRDMAAAMAFSESAEILTGVTPDRVTTDVHDSYPLAIRTTLGADVWHRNSAISTTGGSKIIAVSRAAMARCGGSNARDRLANSAGPTKSCVTSSLPTPARINKSPPTTADPISFATSQRFCAC
jgi:hypothetical protein